MHRQMRRSHPLWHHGHTFSVPHDFFLKNFLYLVLIHDKAPESVRSKRGLEALSLPRQGTMATHATKRKLLHGTTVVRHDDGVAPQGTMVTRPDDGTAPQGSGDAASSKARATPRHMLLHGAPQ
jgi:hypothetical protein